MVHNSTSFKYLIFNIEFITFFIFLDQSSYKRFVSWISFIKKKFWYSCHLFFSFIYFLLKVQQLNICINLLPLYQFTTLFFLQLELYINIQSFFPSNIWIYKFPSKCYFRCILKVLQCYVWVFTCLIFLQWILIK